jgi:hypothetical protein
MRAKIEIEDVVPLMRRARQMLSHHQPHRQENQENKPKNLFLI